MKQGVGLQLFPEHPSPFRTGIGSPMTGLGTILDMAKAMDGGDPSRPNYTRVRRAYVDRYGADINGWGAHRGQWNDAKNEPVYILDSEGNNIRVATMDAEWATNVNPRVLALRFSQGLLGNPSEWDGIPTWEELEDQKFNAHGHRDTVGAFARAGYQGYSKSKPEAIYPGDNLLYDIIAAMESRFRPGQTISMPAPGLYDISGSYRASSWEDEWKEKARDTVHGGVKWYYVSDEAPGTPDTLRTPQTPAPGPGPAPSPELPEVDRLHSQLTEAQKQLAEMKDERDRAKRETLEYSAALEVTREQLAEARKPGPGPGTGPSSKALKVALEALATAMDASVPESGGGKYAVALRRHLEALRKIAKEI